MRGRPVEAVALDYPPALYKKSGIRTEKVRSVLCSCRYRLSALGGLAPDSGRVGGLQLPLNGVDLSFVAGDAIAEPAKFRHVVFQDLKALLHGVEALVEVFVLGVEALVDVLFLVIETLIEVLLLGIEALVHLGPKIAKTFILGVEALVNGIEDGELDEGSECDKDGVNRRDGPYVFSDPVPYLPYRVLLDD